MPDSRELTERQQQNIVDYEGSSLFVEACPGSGKTRTIVERLSRKAPSLPPRKGMAIISFTNAAIDEFEERAAKKSVGYYLKHPGFIGTFDRFIYYFMVQPFGIPGTTTKPRLLEKWDHYACRVGGVPPIPFELFDLETGEIRLDEVPRKMGVNAQHLKWIKNNTILLKDSFLCARRNLAKRHGIISTYEARTIAISRLRNTKFASSLGSALKGRFSEIIIDEAQDCGAVELEILTWLQSVGIHLTFVCDPDQTIYEFRGAQPASIESFKNSMPKWLPITGNFRSTPAICALAATMRSRAKSDLAVGENSNLSLPVQLIGYDPNNPQTIGTSFLKLIRESGIRPESSRILSHKRRIAASAAGTYYRDKEVNSLTSKVARATAEFYSTSSTGSHRTKALQKVMRIILDLKGCLHQGEALSVAIERMAIEERELRRTAVALLGGLKGPCDTPETANKWLDQLRLNVNRLKTLPPGTTPNQKFKRSAILATYLEPLNTGNLESAPWSTIHEAKGHDYPAVCVVIPPKTTSFPDVIDLWVNGAHACEALRVLYVGVTRAQKLLALAVLQAKLNSVSNILRAANVPAGP